MTTVSIEVDRPADTAFDYATDPSKFATWQEGVVSGSMKSNGSPAVGDLCITTRRIGGAQRPATSRLVRYEPPRAWSVHGIDGPIRAKVDVDVEATTSHSSTITITVDFDGHGIGKLLVPLLVRRQASKEMPTNMARLKQQIEKLDRGPHVA